MSLNEETKRRTREGVISFAFEFDFLNPRGSAYDACTLHARDLSLGRVLGMTWSLTTELKRYFVKRLYTTTVVETRNIARWMALALDAVHVKSAQ